MALNPDALKKELEAILITAFTREFGAEAAADGSSHKKMASAISDIGLVIVKTLLTQAQVAPGIPTAGGESAQVTVAPGKII